MPDERAVSRSAKAPPNGRFIPIPLIEPPVVEGERSIPDPSVGDVARMLNQRPRLVRSWAVKGFFPGAYKDGKDWRIPLAGVQSFWRLWRDVEAAGWLPGLGGARPDLAGWRSARDPRNRSAGPDPAAVPLENKRWERFCIELVRQPSHADAYTAAGFTARGKRAEEAAARLLARPEVAARAKYLKAAASIPLEMDRSP